jgi:hypothetical protein
MAKTTGLYSDKITDDQMQELSRRFPFTEGRPYLFVCSFGWGRVGFYAGMETPLMMKIQHCNHFRNATVNYGQMATQGAPAGCEWRYEGGQVIVPVYHILAVMPYAGEVPRG